jgi:hypothetical protein
MPTHAPRLFAIAAIFNFAIALALMFGRALLGPLLKLEPAAGSNALLIDVAAVLIATFGYAYLRAGGDPQRFRPYIVLGVIGKLLVVAVACAHLASGSVAWPLPALASGDLLFAGLFLHYLRGRPAAH